MPNSPSAKKRVRQNASRRSLNTWRKNEIRMQIRKFREAIQSGKAKDAEAEYRKACGLLDKTASTSTLHRNTAARRKSNMARQLASLKKK